MVCHHIRQVDQNQIIISVSANALLADHNNFSELGMNDHIPKPVDYASFSQVLTHWFDQIPTLYASPPKPKYPTANLTSLPKIPGRTIPNQANTMILSGS
ncbi:hypothetical protein DSO57_1010388 [Entomophthora muscae]|nr:hypothetical protein DSO57_1010388 [Entomophthora muscae]